MVRVGCGAVTNPKAESLRGGACGPRRRFLISNMLPRCGITCLRSFTSPITPIRRVKNSRNITMPPSMSAPTPRHRDAVYRFASNHGSGESPIIPRVVPAQRQQQRKSGVQFAAVSRIVDAQAAAAATPPPNRDPYSAPWARNHSKARQTARGAVGSPLQQLGGIDYTVQQLRIGPHPVAVGAPQSIRVVECNLALLLPLAPCDLLGILVQLRLEVTYGLVGATERLCNNDWGCRARTAARGSARDTTGLVRCQYGTTGYAAHRASTSRGYRAVGRMRVVARTVARAAHMSIMPVQPGVPRGAGP